MTAPSSSRASTVSCATSSTSLADGDVVEPVTVDSEDGLAVLRHSTAHVLAQAVQQLHADAKLGIGPPIRDGFYYDFDVETPFHPDDLKALEKAMQKIINEGQTFARRVVTDAEALEELKDEPYKCELVGLKGGNADEAAEGAGVEVGAGELTIYDNIRRDGTRAWGDLCRGPHIPSTKLIGNAFKLMRVGRRLLARLGEEPAAPARLRHRVAHQGRPQGLPRPARRGRAPRPPPHRRRARPLLASPTSSARAWSSSTPRAASSSARWRTTSARRHIEEGFSYVGTPHISKEALFHTSGHLPYYADTMFPPMELEGAKYQLKAMSCPMHNLIYKSRRALLPRAAAAPLRVRRRLPLREVRRRARPDPGAGHDPGRLAQLRHRRAGAGRDQAPARLRARPAAATSASTTSTSSCRPATPRARSPRSSSAPTSSGRRRPKVLEEVATASGLELVPDPGGAAFYGPKISVQARDAIGRTWQMSTIQYDFNQPERFGLEYQAADGIAPAAGHDPLGEVRLDRALPRRARRALRRRVPGVARRRCRCSACRSPRTTPTTSARCWTACSAREFASSSTTSDDRFPKKIRNASKSKVPFTLIAGEEDRAAGAVSFRYRDGSQKNGVPVDDAIAEILAAIESRAQV